MKNIRNTFLSLAILLMACGISFSATINDAFSRDYWVTKTGITTGTTNEILYTYFVSLGYEGSLNDMYIAWLIDQTCLTADSSFNDLLYAYFVDGTTCSPSDKFIYNRDAEHIANRDGDLITYP